MGSAKTSAPPPQRYRDDPLRDERPAPSSVSLHTLDDDEPPPYQEHFRDDDRRAHAVGADRPFNGYVDIAAYDIPTLADSRNSTTGYSVYTYHPDYSQNALELQAVLTQQALFPPRHKVHITGTHTETVRQNNKDSKNTITDFDLALDLTPLLTSTPGVPDPSLPPRLHTAPDDLRTYRGGIFPTKATTPSPDAEAGPDSLRHWCEAFVSSPAGIKSFTLKREITGLDTDKLRQLLTSCVRETKYLGTVSVRFQTLAGEVVIYSPGRINTWRTTPWIRWLFYLSFLWLFSWPILFLCTKKFVVVKALFPVRVNGRPVVKGEGEWFADWEAAVKRAAMGRMQCEIDEAYRVQTLTALARAEELTRQGGQLTTGNAAIDGVVSVARLGLNYLANRQDGWGGDS